MPFSCSFCKIQGDKGYFSYPTGPSRAECLRLAGLPEEQDLKVKMVNLKICFRHYEEKDFYFTVGNKLRLCRGELFIIFIDISKKLFLQIFLDLVSDIIFSPFFRQNTQS